MSRISTVNGEQIESFGDVARYEDNLDATYLSNLKIAYNLLMDKCSYKYDIIPLIVTTDQHRRYSESQLKGVYRFISDKVDMQSISKVLNLGDMTDDGTIAELTNVLDCVNLLPLEKQVNVWGNHDYGNDASQEQAWVREYFKNDHTARYGGGNGYFVAYDNIYNVKYVCLNDWEHVGSAEGVHYYGSVSTEQIEWAIKELSKNDGYDVILCSHNAWVSTGVTWYDQDNNRWVENYDRSTESQWEHESDVLADWLQLLSYRKNKKSGTFTDCLGVTHSYDFSDCENDLIMSLHGHWHDDFYKHLENSITMYEFDCFKELYAVHFCYIDRKNKKFGVIKVQQGWGNKQWEIDIN